MATKIKKYHRTIPNILQHQGPARPGPIEKCFGTIFFVLCVIVNIYFKTGTLILLAKYDVNPANKMLLSICIVTDFIMGIGFGLSGFKDDRNFAFWKIPTLLVLTLGKEDLLHFYDHRFEKLHSDILDIMTLLNSLLSTPVIGIIFKEIESLKNDSEIPLQRTNILVISLLAATIFLGLKSLGFLLFCKFTHFRMVELSTTE
ncbi:hypothetical protein G9A89_023789 [Geosiphon pyriformis]|nr:hypothetical protein G9A89_023789 [Geosiphon pyriformis]